jgi:hypothetical protein
MVLCVFKYVVCNKLEVGSRRIKKIVWIVCKKERRLSIKIDFRT